MRERPAHRLLAGLVAILLASGCATIRGTADRPAVTSLEIEGVEVVSASDVESKLATQPSEGFFWAFFWPEQHNLDPDALANDRKRVERYLQAQGYYAARVENVEVKPDGEGRVEVVFHVLEGPPTRVKEVNVTGLEGAPQAAAALAELPIRAGDIFTEEKYDGTKAAILSALQATGYAQAEVTGHADVDLAAQEARVEYKVDPKAQYRFGNVLVAGTAQVPRARVREQAEIAIHPGEVYDSTQLPNAQSRVFDLGVFGGVRVSPGTPDEERKSIPVVVSVREAPFRTVRVGPGIGIQATRWDAHLVAGWADRNFLGGLRKLSIDGRAGYAWLPQPFNPTKRGFIGLITTDFTQPGVIGRQVDLGVRTELERGVEQAFNFTSERFRLSLPLRFARSWTLIPSYNIEIYQLTDIPPFGPTASGTPQILQSCPGTNCVLSYLEQRIAWDGRDDPFNTRLGLYAGISLQEGFRVFDDEFRFLRLLPEVKGFVPLGRRLVMAAHLQLGFLRPLPSGTDELGVQATPIVARFTAGGPASMRGYYIRQLSPVAAARDASGNFLYWVPLGGNGMVVGSAELRLSLTEALGAVLFLDAANVTLRYRDVFDLRQLQYAAGVGLRYRTPFGPLRIDVASRLPTPVRGKWGLPSVPVVEIRSCSGSSGQNCYVEVGEHSEQIVAVHLSLGEAF